MSFGTTSGTLVQVGDRLDTYWDIFRDYLNTGRVPLKDSYILRSAPNQIARMLPLVMKNGGSTTVTVLAADLNTSDNVIFNLSRELRLLGVTAYQPLTVRIVDDILTAPDPELAARQKVTNSEGTVPIRPYLRSGRTAAPAR